MLKMLRSKTAQLIASLALALVPMLVPAVVAAAPAGGTGTTGSPDIGTCLSQGSGLTISDTGCTAASGQTDAGTKVNGIITTAVNIFSIVVGIVAVVMIIYGGFKYITSGGESSNISGAKNTIIYAVIGLVIVAFAQFLVQFVLNKVSPSS
ncbi:MAG TPA: pilin [Candidatus Saccharimonadales bacterium]|nr:pilin [Candidatus Saccharimonadales bacterium]